jgi:hypothetical protein
VTTLSYAADLGLGQPMEHCMRQLVTIYDGHKPGEYLVVLGRKL